ncbi:phosphotransferase [Micrococcus sp. R8502A1]|uniref:phosphotransferase n=1 Tax=Micrococcus sp. R8502A1 TaxID=2583239 RepID=UPI0011515192|nr:phosphotransferase [Micrococcus sp. R8502A1]TQF75448.1 phosphotransferase [Micrococcus sp. R8502A1]
MVSPPAPSELELAHRALQHLRPGLDPALARRLRTADWAAASVEEGGQFHRVLVLDDAAVLRMTRLREAGAPIETTWDPADSPAALLPRRMALVAALARAGLPFVVPEPLSEVVTVHDGAGHPLIASVLQRFVPGGPHPPHEGDPAVLRGIVDALDTVDVASPEVAPHLGPAFAFRGPWTPARIARVGRLPEVLEPEHAGRLRERLPVGDFAGVVERVAGAVTAWAAAPPDGPALVHGDLAGHNMHWLPEPAPTAEAPAAVRWRLAAVLDWDLAHAGDAARNVAYLGIWHGEERIEEIARTPDEARRARVWLAAAALDSLDDARARHELTGRAPRWGRLLRRVAPRIARAAALES